MSATNIAFVIKFCIRFEVLQLLQHRRMFKRVCITNECILSAGTAVACKANSCTCNNALGSNVGNCLTCVLPLCISDSKDNNHSAHCSLDFSLKLKQKVENR